MSVTVPTASGTEASGSPPPDDSGRRRRGWVVLVVLAVVAVALWDREPPTEEISAEEVGPPSVTYPEVRELALAAVPALRSETFFPGDGTFTAHARSIQGQVAVGQRSRRPGAFVFTTDPAGETWTPGSIEVAERAWVADVSPWMDTFVVGGAIAGPGMGSSIPTLWTGTEAGEFRVEEHPFPGPGRVDRIRVVHGDMFLMGQGAAPSTDTREPGSARFGRLLVGRPGAWSDITPDGFNVIVNDVVGYGDGLVAVGGNHEGAVVWWLASGSDQWVTIDLGPGMATGATMTSETGLVVSAFTSSPEGETVSLLFAGDAPGSLAPVGSPIRARIGDIASYDGGVLGTSVPDGASLWWYRFGKGWATIGVGAVVGLDRVVLDATTTPDLVAFGSAAGQPVLWSGGLAEPQVLDGSTVDEWEFVTLLPGGATQVLDVGTHVFAYRNTLDAETVWVSSNRSPWRGIETVDGFGLAGAAGNDDGWTLFGETETAGVVYSASANEPLSVQLVPAASLHHAVRVGSVLTVLATTDAGPVRIEFVDGAERFREPLDHLPARILQAGPILVGGEFGTGTVTVSRDEGRSWESLPGTHATVGWTGRRTLLVSADGVVSVLYPDTLDLMSLDDVDPSRSIIWGDGVLEASGFEFRLVARPTGEAVDVGVGAESGIDGVFERPIAGPNGYVLVSERGIPALYRWMRNFP